MSDEHLPLGYLVPDKVLVQYARKHNHREMSDEECLVVSQFIALANANADNSDATWADSNFSDGMPPVIYLQISGGGPNKWRIPKDVEDRLCAELGLTGNPVQFKPEKYGMLE